MLTNILQKIEWGLHNWSNSEGLEMQEDNAFLVYNLNVIDLKFEMLLQWIQYVKMRVLCCETSKRLEPVRIKSYWLWNQIWRTGQSISSHLITLCVLYTIGNSNFNWKHVWTRWSWIKNVGHRGETFSPTSVLWWSYKYNRLQWNSSRWLYDI
jgi:hypothetical protein